MSSVVRERVVSYWAVQGERWCNVTGLVNQELAKEWEASGWRVVTRVIERHVDIIGELEERT